MKNTSSLAEAFVTSIICVTIYHFVCRLGNYIGDILICKGA